MSTTLDRAEIVINGSLAEVTFGRYDLEAYRLFLRAKKLPESQLTYDWQTDSYLLTTPARFAAMLGAPLSGAPIEPTPIAAHLFDYQRFTLKRALEAERYAAWLETGLGKAIVGLEWARQVVHLTNGRVLYFVPTVELVRQISDQARQFYGDGLVIERPPTREAMADWCRQPGPGVAIVTYHKMIPGILSELRWLAGIVADESSILKGGGGVIKWNLIKSARGVRYKLSLTATPAPNDTMEYASQASFLEKLRTEGDILWTYFTRDKYGNWSVKPHARSAFYEFMSSWSIYMRDPARFGFADILSTLPPPDIREYRLDMTPAQREWRLGFLVKSGKGMFDDRLGVRERSKLSQLAKGFIYQRETDEKAPAQFDSLKPRFVADLARQEVASGRQAIIWTVFDEEARLLAEVLADAPFSVATLDGSQSDEARSQALDDFRSGQTAVLISKSQLLGYGLNLQFCRSMIFSGWDDSFERLYQAIRRCYRFGQTETVRVHIPYIPELEGMMLDNVKAKEAAFNADAAIQEHWYRRALGLTTEREGEV